LEKKTENVAVAAQEDNSPEEAPSPPRKKLRFRLMSKPQGSNRNSFAMVEKPSDASAPSMINNDNKASQRNSREDRHHMLVYRLLAAAQDTPAGGNSGTVHFYHWDKVSPSRKAPNGALELRSLTPGLFIGFDCSHRWPSRASPLSLYARFLRTRRGATSLAVAATATYSFGR